MISSTKQRTALHVLYERAGQCCEKAEQLAADIEPVLTEELNHVLIDGEQIHAALARNFEVPLVTSNFYLTSFHLADAEKLVRAAAVLTEIKPHYIDKQKQQDLFTRITTLRKRMTELEPAKDSFVRAHTLVMRELESRTHKGNK